MRYILPTLFAVLLLSLLNGCGFGGGGGGGDDYDDLKGATVTIQVEPKDIDVGDRTQVRVRLTRINPEGVLVVVRYSAGALDLVDESVEFEVGGDTVAINPTFGPANRTIWDYITFYLPQSAFGDESEGELTFQLLGEKREPDARVEVDERIPTPGVAPENQFSLSDPDFTAEESIDLTVRNR